jgi:predicted O-methyltransferase YrrM
MYFDLLLTKLNPGGFLLADNVLWNGKVTDASAQDAETNAIRLFNEKVTDEPSVEQIILPIRDGLSLIRKK